MMPSRQLFAIFLSVCIGCAFAGIANGTHPVVSTHEKTSNGARFNVQTVKDLGPKIGTVDAKSIVSDIAGEYYKKPSIDFFSSMRAPKVSIESSNIETKGNTLVGAGSFIDAVYKAFAEHYPLTIRPDDLWVLITYAFAKHVDQNGEALRKNFVDFEGKKTLKVQIDSFTMGRMAPEDWEQNVFPDFSEQIREFIGDKTHGALTKSFSTTTVVDKAAFEITMMAALKTYFDYKCSTECGIPWIELEGSEQDWIDLRERTAALREMVMPEFGDKWLAHLLLVLDEFVLSYQGKVNHYFWQGIYKRVNVGEGSGSYTAISGWAHLFYPFMADGSVNQFMNSWKEMVSSIGPEPYDLPSVVVSHAPVEWKYYGTSYPLHFHAGAFGFAQDPETLALRSVIGWAITHDPKEEPDETPELGFEEQGLPVEEATTAELPRQKYQYSSYEQFGLDEVDEMQPRTKNRGFIKKLKAMFSNRKSN